MVARIKLIVTGDMERQALAESLTRFFPEKNANGDEVIWEKSRKLQCATSHRLKPKAQTASTQMRELARAMIDEAINGKTGTPCDLVIAVDDVELANLGQEDVVAEHFRLACRQALADKASSAQTRIRYEQVVKAKCSFHLLRPMVESYLFGDPAALAVSGVMGGVEPRLLHPTNVEDFEVTDPEWLPKCRQENDKAKPMRPWWREECHPKRYLEHLIQRSGGPGYDETDQGRRALLALQWAEVPKAPTDATFLRAMFEDIAYWFAVPSPLGAGATAPGFYPGSTINHRQLMLRNL